jgi:hypothetical protein
MSEAQFERDAGRESAPTGVPAVDEAIASVDALADAPIEQHAAVFGAAHDALRRALDAQPEA